MKRAIASLFGIFGLIVWVTVAAPETANATLIGGKWPNKGTFILYYSYGGNHRYEGNVWQGAKNWTDKSVRPNIKPWPGVPYKIHMDVVDERTNETYWGYTALSPCNTCTYTRARIVYNATTMDREGDFIRTKVGTHEFGHSIGIDHSPASKTSVMKQGRLDYNKPQTYDVNEVNRRYPQ